MGIRATCQMGNMQETPRPAEKEIPVPSKDSGKEIEEARVRDMMALAGPGIVVIQPDSRQTDHEIERNRRRQEQEERNRLEEAARIENERIEQERQEKMRKEKEQAAEKQRKEKEEAARI